MSLSSISNLFPMFCQTLKLLDTEIEETLKGCEEARATFFSVVVLYKIKIDSIKKKLKELKDKSIHLDLDSNLKPDTTKISLGLNTGVHFNYPYEVCPPEVLDSLMSFSLTFESKDKEGLTDNLQCLNNILAQFKEFPQAKSLEDLYHISILSEGLKNHLIISLKCKEKFKELINKFKTVFPIDKYFLSFNGNLNISYGIKWNEYQGEEKREELISKLKLPHASFDLSMRNFEIANELFATFQKMSKMFNKVEGTTIPDPQDKESIKFVNMLLSFINAFDALALDFKMLPSAEILEKIYKDFVVDNALGIMLEYKSLLIPFMDLVKMIEEKIEINMVYPILMLRFNAFVMAKGFKEFIAK